MNRWYFCVLAPVMLGSAWIIGVMTDPPTLVGRVVAYAIALTLVVGTLAMANPRRFSWAVRTVAGAILLAYVSYVAVEATAFAQGKPFGWGGRRSDTSLRNALLGLLIFGLPAALVAFRRHAADQPNDASFQVEETAEQGDEADEARDR